MKYLIEPIAKPRMTQSDKWRKRPATTQYWIYKAALQKLKVTLPIPCSILFELPMPESWSKKKRKEMNGKPHESKPDIDNLIKGIFDALLENDQVVWGVYAEKRWAEVPSITIKKTS
jgi:Holliday junction resolvase RusA-like endonuclease